MANSAKIYQARLSTHYTEKIRPELQKELKLKNIHEVPKLEKLVINVGTGRFAEDKRHNETVVNTLRKITGQQPLETKSRKSIAGFKLREGQKIGYKVTLRGERMYDFLDRLVNVVLPRVRDFHGVNDKFDKQGNFNLGMKDQSVFTELSFEETTTLHGLQITFVTTSEDPEHSRALLIKLGVPFVKNKEIN